MTITTEKTIRFFKNLTQTYGYTNYSKGVNHVTVTQVTTGSSGSEVIRAIEARNPFYYQRNIFELSTNQLKQTSYLEGQYIFGFEEQTSYFRPRYKLPVLDFTNRIYAGDGDDVLNASVNGGVDSLYGENGNDTLYGNKNSDFLSGGAGNDYALGYEGDDYMDGGSGNDHLRGGYGDDQLAGWSGDDILRGGPGNDFLSGGDGRDFLTGDGGIDVLRGGDGRDALYDVGGSGNELYGGELGDTITSAYHARYSSVGDQNFLYGEGGNDKLTGQGSDHLFGGVGNDRLTAKGGNNLLDGGAGADLFVVNQSHEGVDVLNKQTTINDFTHEDKIYVGGTIETIFVADPLTSGITETQVYGQNTAGDTLIVATLKHGNGYQGEDLVLSGGYITIA